MTMIKSFVAMWAALGVALAASQAVAQPVEVDSVLVRLIEQVDVPAQELGLLTHVAVREGQIVSQGAALAQIDDTEARLAQQRAQLELEIARKEAGNDVKVRFAKESLAIAEAELRRAAESIETFEKSVSETEMDRLRLAVEKGKLEVEQAQHEFELEALDQRLKENELEFAAHSIARRKITAPIGGVIVEIRRRRGEWVQPGEKVLRILRIDRLKAEGFVDAADIDRVSEGDAVTLVADLPGKPAAKFSGTIVFVSPEIDPVNRQVRVWAEIENRDLLLKPGHRGRLVVGGKRKVGK